MTTRSIAVTLTAGLVLLATACNDDGRYMREPRPDQTLSIITTTVAPEGELPIDTLPLDTLPLDTLPIVEPSDDTAGQVLPDEDALALEGFEVAMPWPEGGRIDRRFTCEGEDVSPTLRWTGLPESTVEVAIVVTDTSIGADDPDHPVHWVVAGLDPSLEQLEQDAVPDTAIVGSNDFGLADWTGPCPPSGETHTYEVEVHALTQQTEVPFGAPADELLRAIDFATVAMATGTGTFTGGN